MHSNGTCTICPSTHYCNNNEMHSCEAIGRPQSGSEFLNRWNEGGQGKHTSTQCFCRWDDTRGNEGATNIQYQHHCWRGMTGNGGNGEYILSAWCRVGFYPQALHNTCWRWYRRCDPCTNAPANAHYTGRGSDWNTDGFNPACGHATPTGTPNDCPWACNNGFSRVRTDSNPVNDICVAVCPVAGMNRIRTGNGLSIPLVAAKTNARAIHVQTAGGICYAPLVSGQSTGALNVNIGGQIWHAR